MTRLSTTRAYLGKMSGLFYSIIFFEISAAVQ